MMSEEKPTSPDLLITDGEYCNTRYYFCATYPDTLLPIKLISDNGDGVILRTADDQVVVTLAGSRSILNRNTPELYDDFVSEWMTNNDDGRIVSHTIEIPYYEVSFIDGKQHYYQKLFHRGNKYLIYQIVTPIEEAHRIDKVRKHLDISF